VLLIVPPRDRRYDVVGKVPDRFAEFPVLVVEIEVDHIWLLIV
jgi:hypothetical protein